MQYVNGLESEDAELWPKIVKVIIIQPNQFEFFRFNFFDCWNQKLEAFEANKLC